MIDSVKFYSSYHKVAWNICEKVFWENNFQDINENMIKTAAFRVYKETECDDSDFNWCICEKNLNRIMVSYHHSAGGDW